MKLLRVTARNFKNCKDNYTIDFTTRAKKTSEDKLYELQEIAPNLFTYNTMAFVGKNASGKTTAIDLIVCCHYILSNFHFESTRYSVDNTELDIYFYHEGNIYRYTTVLKENKTILKNGKPDAKKAEFTNEHIYRKIYTSSKAGKIFCDDGFEEMDKFTDLPADTSKIFFILREERHEAFYFDSNDDDFISYRFLFAYMRLYDVPSELFYKVLSIFDENIKELDITEDENFRINYNGVEETKSAEELMWFLSSGTTKGMILYTLMIISLTKGCDLIIDEVENHFHKTLVENMISLYKDPTVNKNNATLIFTTHYCELLDLFGRKDNIWIAKSDEKVYLQNMHDVYKENNIRPELLKSKQFYNNTFDTAVNYKALMDFKRELMK